MKFLLALILTLPCFALAQVNHQTWDALLKKHVNDKGNVNYLGFKNDVAELNSYLKDLRNNEPEANWIKNEKLAYWINAYNAFTVKAILNHYPVKSITDIKPKGVESIWKLKWIKIGDKTLSLDEIEHEIIRPRFNEPRIHFAVNCASVSCPPLRNEAFVADKLEAQLTEQTEKFLADNTRNIITKDMAQLSKVFDWFADDFKQNGSLIDFINKYSKVKISSKTTITYLKYDWSLND